MKRFIIIAIWLTCAAAFAAELPLSEGIPRFKANEDRVDRFVNTFAPYTTNTGTPETVESLPAFMVRKETELDAYATAANGDTLVEDEAALNAAIASGSVTSIVLLQSFSMTGNITVTKPLRIKSGAIITTTGYTFDDGGFLNNTGRYQIFAGTGTVTLHGEAFPEWWANNTSPGTTDTEDAWNKATAAATVINGLGTYAVSDTVLVGDGRKLVGNFTLKAITGMANKPVILVKEGDGSTVAWGVDIGNGVTIDGNDIALTGIETYYARDCKFQPTKITRVNKYGIILGDTGAAAVSTDNNIYNTTVWYHEDGDPVSKGGSYANPSDSIGIYYRNCTDSLVVNTSSVGFRVGFETSATSGSVNFVSDHAWSRRAHGPMLASFRSYGSNGSFTQCYADTPHNWYSTDGATYTQDATITAVYGFYIDSFSQAIANSKVYMNSDPAFGATDELLTAVHFAKAEYGHVFGLQLQGADASYKYNYIYGGTTSNATILGTGIPAAGTLANTSSVFDQVGLRKVNFAPTMLAIDGAAGTIREMEVSTAGSPRIRIGGNSTAEGGSDAGTDFNIRVYDDTGTIKYTPMTITRSTGYLTLSRVPTYADNTAALAGGLVAGQVYKTGAGALMIVY